MQTVALYARISTKEGRQFLSNQLAALNKRAQFEGWRIVDTITDEQTGTKSAPGWHKILELAQARKIRRVLVWKLDRITRQGPAYAFAQIHNLAQNGVHLVSLQEPMFDSSGTFGPVLIAIAAWIAEQESIVLSERVRAGLRRARGEGKKLGPPFRIYDRQKLADLRAQGYGLNRMAKALGVSRASANRYIKELERSRANVDSANCEARRPDAQEERSRAASENECQSQAQPSGSGRQTRAMGGTKAKKTGGGTKVTAQKHR